MLFFESFLLIVACMFGFLAAKAAFEPLQLPDLVFKKLNSPFFLFLSVTPINSIFS